MEACRLKSCDQFCQFSLPTVRAKNGDRHNVRYITYNDVRTWVLCDKALLISDKRHYTNSSNFGHRRANAES